MATRIRPAEPVRQRTVSHRGTTPEKRHFGFIHQLQCAITGRAYPIDAAHVRSPCDFYAKPLAGVGAKPSFIWTLPLTKEQHDLQHKIGEREYWASNNMALDGPIELTPFSMCLALAAYSQINDVQGAQAYLVAHRMRRRMVE